MQNFAEIHHAEVLNGFSLPTPSSLGEGDFLGGGVRVVDSRIPPPSQQPQKRIGMYAPERMRIGSFAQPGGHGLPDGG